MKRRWIALLIACAALVVCGMVWGNWKWIAYRNYETKDWTGYAKRWTWLPGGDCWAPDQVCHGCKLEKHEHWLVFGKQDTIGTLRSGVPFIEPELASNLSLDEDMKTIEDLLSLCICQKCFPGRTAR